MAGLDKNTVLLMHMESEPFLDSSISEHNPSEVGDAMLSSTKARFGNYSAYFNGSNNYITLPDSVDFDFQDCDFTIDFQANWATSGGSDATLLVLNSGQPEPIGVTLGYNNDGLLGYYVGNPLTTWNYSIGGGSLNDGNWHHIAIVRDSGTVKFFIDGQLSSGTPGGSVIVPAANRVGSTTFNGYIDELRISQGIARWTSNFTPPTSVYANSIVSGNAGAGGTIYIIDETSKTIESYEDVTAGSFSCNVDDGNKLVLLRASTGEVKGFGDVTPVGNQDAGTAMTNRCSGGTAWATSTYEGTGGAIAAFDGNTGGTNNPYLWGSTADDTQALGYTFTSAVTIKKIRMYAADDGATYKRTPTGFMLRAANSAPSNYDTDGELLYQASGVVTYPINSFRDFWFDNNVAYTNYWIYMTDKEDAFGKSAEYFVDELEMYG